MTRLLTAPPFTARLLSAVLLLVIALGWAGVPARADQAGLDLIVNETVRAGHPDWPDSQTSSVVRTRRLGYWHRQWEEPDQLVVEAEHEDYTLESAGGLRLIDLDLLKLHPRLRLRDERWALDTGLLMLEATRNASTYVPIATDNRERLYLPAVVLDLTPRPLLFRAGLWQEYDVLPLNLNTYALSVAQVSLVGVGYQPTPRSEAWIRVQESRRFYPRGFDIARTNVLVDYRLRDPLERGESAWWREAYAEWALEHYPGTGEAFHKLALNSVLWHRTGASTHFLIPTLTLTDSYVVYRRGALPESLLEFNVRESDALLKLAYEGFRKLSGGAFLFAWGLTVEESLRQQVQHTRVAHIKAEYLF